MNQISNFICFLSCLIHIYCWDNNLIIENDKRQYLYFLENERYYLNDVNIAIPFTNMEDLQEKLNEPSSLQLLQQQQELNLIFNDEDAILLPFIRQSENYIDICYLQHQIIDCKFRINNTLYNEELIVNQIQSNQLFIPSNSCQNAFLLQDDLFLIQCHNPINQFQYFMLNNYSEVVDEITFDLPKNCRFDSKFQFNRIFINSLQCEVSIVLVVDMIYLDEKLQFNKNYTKLHELANFPNQGNLIDLKICQSNIILLGFINMLSTYNFQDQSFKSLKWQYKTWFPYLQSCFPLLIRGTLQPQSKVDYYYNPALCKMLESEPQIKSIEVSDEFCIYLYEKQAIITYDYFFQQTIQNVKQIFKLSTLPFLVILNKNNNIAFYKITCFKQYIEYTHFPFIAIFMKGVFYHMNEQIFTYYEAQEYSIKYPLDVLINSGVEIWHSKIINNNFKIDINQIQLSIPFYLDLEFDEDRNHFEFQNECIFTYHLMLPIKQILRVVSFEMNCLLIIYEDWNQKIMANLKKGDFNKNFQLIAKTQEFQVEVNKMNSDFIIILIGSKLLMKFRIFNYKNLEQIQYYKPKTKIIQYIKEVKAVICLLADNTIYTYEFDNFVDYSLTKNKEFRDYWAKNHQEKYTDFRAPHLYINYEDSIIHMKSIKPYHHDYVLSVDGQIISSNVFVTQKRILLIVKKENQTQLLLYFFDLDNIILLYEIPTFEFQVVFPIQMKQYGQLFCITTMKNEQEYLFIYDITQQGRYCLRYISKKLPNVINFELVDETGILLQILTDKIVFTYSTISFNIKYQNASFSAIINTQIKFQAKSYIQSIPSSFIIYLHIFNKDTVLKYKPEAKSKKLLLSSQNQITNLESIFGGIDNLQLSGACQGSLKEPIQVVSNIQLKCQYISQRFCMISKSLLIYDYLGLNQTVSLSIEKIFLNNLIISNYNTKIFIYNFRLGTMSFLDSYENQESEEETIGNSPFQGLLDTQFDHYIKSINLIDDYLITEREQYFQIHKTKENESNLQCSIYSEGMKQIEYLYKIDSQFILLILEINSKICLSSCSDNTNELKSSNEFKPDFQIVSFKILNSIIQNQEIQITIALFCPQDMAYIYEFIYDFNLLTLLKYSNHQYLKYSNIIFENFLKVSDTIYVMKGNSQNQTSSYYLYQINISQPVELIDYVYKYEKDGEIQVYNETHFIQIQRDKEDKDYANIFLLEIDYYRLYLEKNCDLLIKNDVSILYSHIDFEDNLKNKSFMPLYVEVVNFLLILLFITKKKNNNVSRNNAST
ncbi:unnamed protein product (macronuclear) [Paramecium tetraurelia]|uniref:Transmembrane protein n=1 Tax=Paramecium tetraurelia TaxID=5888 RepID=A0DMI4_PARTE|nr:uncharacterized protein GSPATT00018469001 [Paramecium tetraurelia]CAK84251.1 unnamed protein product [Paramecium tetraurelia]|eukprot:XP_001451648.1 hypothetical protein (macronuclear) [Paramecium tetraurelia strain d4-2]